ncbi:MAG TPA: hypothetical protein VNL77_19695 [Roseiflexaceae bacterium]|nr:hypothetical protein [Roseiflexaceae bacterium]
MARQRTLKVADQRAVTPRLRWLTLAAPDLAREVRAGHYLLLRCDEPGGAARLLRRPLFVAAAEPALGQVGLVFEPDEPGLAWLARAHPGDELDAIGPLGRPFTLAPRTGSVLLIGSGRGLPALMQLAREAAARRAAVTLLAGATHREALPPPFLLPGEIEYQAAPGDALDLLSAPAGGRSPPPGQSLLWADQLFAAIPNESVARLRDTVRAAKLRWERGYANVLLDGPLVCGVGACGVCAVELRRGPQLLCSAGPVFDLRDLA